MSTVMFDRFGAESPANFGIFTNPKVKACPDLPVAVIRVSRDMDSPLDGANAAAARLLGYELPRRLIRVTPKQLFADPRMYHGIVAQLLFARDATASVESELRRKDGSRVWVRVHAQTVTDPAHEPGQINMVLVDIGDRKALEDALEESDARFRAIVDKAAEGILLVDPGSKRIFSGNPQICQMLGYSEKELESLTLADIHLKESMPSIDEHFQKQAKGEITRVRDVPTVRKDGSILYADINAFTLALDGRSTVVGFFHDVTDRKQVEGESKIYQERLRSLALESSLAEERERRRLAGHLHDEVGQLLSLAQIRLSLIEPSVMHPECQKGAREMQKLLDRALRATRSLTFQLSHPAVYDLGFLAGVEWLVEDIKDLYSLEVVLSDDRHHKPLDLRSRVLLLQCMRELLVNIAKHAGVKTATVRLSREAATVRVMVEDGGSGFELRNLRQTTQKGGFGLFSIRERLRSLGGAMDIQSSPGLGTCVALDVPVDSETKEHST